MRNFFIFIFIMFLLASPLFSLAQEGLVPCGKGAVENPCDFGDFMILLNKLVNYILFTLAIPIAAIMFAWAGFLLVTAGGGEGRTRAKGILWNVVIGLALALLSWVIINTLLTVMGYDGDWIGF